MNQVRFQIGIPRAGSAARSSEEERRPMGRPSLAGSAAREVEERRKAELPFERTHNCIALRATGGVTANGSAAADVSPRKNAETSQFSVNHGTVPSTCAAAAEARGFSAPGSGKVEVTPGSGATQSIASRISSLTRSLFERDTDG